MNRAEKPTSALTDGVFLPDQPIIDVELAFRNATARYTLLEQTVSSLLHAMADLPPRQILLRSRQIATIQQGLAAQDQQLVDILNLAGQEIVNADFTWAYREVLARVILSCDLLRARMVTIRDEIGEGCDHREKS